MWAHSDLFKPFGNLSDAPLLHLTTHTAKMYLPYPLWLKTKENDQKDKNQERKCYHELQSCNQAESYQLNKK